MRRKRRKVRMRTYEKDEKKVRKRTCEKDETESKDENL
jgi:hypothetical protein